MKHPKRPRDINQLAYQIVQEATACVAEYAAAEDSAQNETPKKNPHAVALGSLGGKRGGKARAEKLTPERRSEIAKRAAEARWKKK